MSNARNIASIAGEDVLNASNEIVPVYACRAWVNFNGKTGTTADNKTIRAHGNISSVYENTAGNYQINFDNPMPHDNYAVAVFGSNEESSSIALPSFGGPNGISPAGAARSTYQQTGSVRVYFTNPNNFTGGVDKQTVTVAIFC